MTSPRLAGISALTDHDPLTLHHTPICQENLDAMKPWIVLGLILCGMNIAIGETRYENGDPIADGESERPGVVTRTIETPVTRSTPGNYTADITSINSQNFPNIFMNLEIDDPNNLGCTINSLQEADFVVTEDGRIESNDLDFEVTPPQTQGGSRGVDILFVVDNSGSMGDEQTAIDNNLTNRPRSTITWGTWFLR